MKITSPVRPLIAGQVHEFTCQSSGSRPPARLSWLKNGLELDGKLARQVDTVISSAAPNSAVASAGQSVKSLVNSPATVLTSPVPFSNSGVQEELSAGSLALPAISVSRLALRLERDDHNARLSCRAENANFRPSKATSRTSKLTTSDVKPNVVSEMPQEEVEREQEVRLTTIRSSIDDDLDANHSTVTHEPALDWLLEDSMTLSVHCEYTRSPTIHNILPFSSCRRLTNRD